MEKDRIIFWCVLIIVFLALGLGATYGNGYESGYDDGYYQALDDYNIKGDMITESTRFHDEN